MKGIMIEIDAEKARGDFINRCAEGLWSPATARLVILVTKIINGYKQHDGRRSYFSDNDIHTLQWILSQVNSGPNWRGELIRLFKEANIPTG